MSEFVGEQQEAIMGAIETEETRAAFNTNYRELVVAIGSGTRAEIVTALNSFQDGLLVDFFETMLAVVSSKI